MLKRKANDPINLITKEVVENVLKKQFGPDATLSSFKIVNFTKPGDNFLSLTTRILCYFELKGQLDEISYIVKLNIYENEDVKRHFLKERKFLEEVPPIVNNILRSAAQPNLRIPKLFSSSSGDEFLVLEDIRNPFRMAKESSLSSEHVILVLKELARLHASGYIHKKRLEKSGKDLLEEFPYMAARFSEDSEGFCLVKSLMTTSVNNGIGILEEIGGYEATVEFMKEVVRNISAELNRSLRRSERFDSVCHGDCWAGNCLFRYHDDEPVEVVLLDFQECFITSVVTDILCLFFSNVKGDARKKNFDRFLLTYYKTFVHIVEVEGSYKVPFTLEELKQEYTDKMMWGFFIAMLDIPVTVKKYEKETKENESTEFSLENLGDSEKVESYRKLVRQHSELKDELLSVFEEFIESGILPGRETGACDTHGKRISTVEANEHKNFAKENGATRKEETEKKKEPSPKSLITEHVMQMVVKKDLGPTAVLFNHQIVDFAKPGDGYATFTTGVRCRVSLAGQLQDACYVVKLRQMWGMESFTKLVPGLFETEGKFLCEATPMVNEILNSVGQSNLKVATCLHASYTLNKEMLVLKDLRPLGFKMVNGKSKGLDVEHVLLVMKEVAKLHAVGAIYRSRAEAEGGTLLKYFPYLSETFIMDKSEALIGMFASCFENAVELLETVGGYDRGIAFLKKLLPNTSGELRETVNTYSKKFETICHGDLWFNNLLFRYDREDKPVEVTLLDLQGPFVGSPIFDLCYFLYTSTDGHLRASNIDLFLNSYYRVFEEIVTKEGSMKMPFTRKELKEEFLSKRLIGFYMAMMGPIMLREEEDVLTIKDATDDTVEAHLREDNVKSKQLILTNPAFKTRFLAVFDEFIKDGLM